MMITRPQFSFHFLFFQIFYLFTISHGNKINFHVLTATGKILYVEKKIIKKKN